MYPGALIFNTNKYTEEERRGIGDAKKSQQGKGAKRKWGKMGRRKYENESSN